MSQQTHQFQAENINNQRWLVDALIGDKYFRSITQNIGAIPLQLMLDELPAGDVLEVKADNNGTDNYDFLYWSDAPTKEAAVAKSVSSLLNLLGSVGVDEPLIYVAYVGTSVDTAQDMTQFAVRVQEDILSAGSLDSSADFEI